MGERRIRASERYANPLGALATSIVLQVAVACVGVVAVPRAALADPGAAPVPPLIQSAATFTITEGQTAPLSVDVLGNGSVYESSTSKAFGSWTTNNPTLATIVDGTLTGVKAGSATITAVRTVTGAPPVQYSWAVTVKGRQAIHITPPVNLLGHPLDSVLVGTSVDFEVTGSAALSGKAVTFEVASTSDLQARVDPEYPNRIHIRQPGAVVVTVALAEDPTVTDSWSVTAVPACGAGEYHDGTGKCEAMSAALLSGVLLRYGFTAGIAVAVHVPLPAIDGAGTTAVGVSPMGYIGFFPAYWSWYKDPGHRAYCARGFTDDITESARAASAEYAMTLPRQSTVVTVRENGDTKSTPLVTEMAFSLNASVPSSALQVLETKLQAKKPDLNANPAMVQGASNAPRSPPVVAPRQYHCTGAWFGGYVGVPATFQANGTVPSAEAVANPASRSVRPVVSSGLVIAPSPWINFLLGLTYSNIQTDITPGLVTSTTKATAPDVSTLTMMIGVGGPFDLASLVIGAK